MCYHCLRMMIANRTDPATGIFKGLDLGLGGAANEKVTMPEAQPRPPLLQRESESETAKTDKPNISPNEYKLGTAVPE